MKLKLLFFIAVFFTLNAHAQIGINTLNPDTSAALEVYSNDKGMLIPRMSAVQRVALPMKYTPADGLLVYDTTYSMFFYWSKAQNNWEAINPMQFSVDDLGNNSNLVLKSTLIGSKNVGIGVDIPLQKLHVNGNMQAEGNINASDTINAHTFVGYGTIPVGGIIMWSGSTVPDGWAICNGQITNGIQTPDLRGRFIVGYNTVDNDYKTIGQTGGSKTHNHDISFNATSLFTGVKQSITISGTTGEVTDDYGKDGYYGGLDGGGWTHTHPVNLSTEYTPSGSVVTTISSGGGSNKTELTDNRPPYYALAFIMRVK